MVLPHNYPPLKCSRLAISKLCVKVRVSGQQSSLNNIFSELDIRFTFTLSMSSLNVNVTQWNLGSVKSESKVKKTGYGIVVKNQISTGNSK